MGWIKSAWRWFWNHLQNVALLVGWAVSFGLPVWAVAATDWLAAYGPIAWVLSGILGILTFAGVLALIAFARARIIWGTIQNRFYQATDRINPVESHFFRKRIRLEDLLPPGQNAVEDKTFEQCELIGPLNIYMAFCSTQQNIFIAVDHIIVDEKAMRDGRILNARIFRNCRFIKCNIYNVSFLMLETSYAETNFWGGANWITYTPDNPAQPALLPANSPNESLAPPLPKDTATETPQ